MKRKRIELILIPVLIIGLVWSYNADMEQRSLSNKLIRLHIVANSDSDEDQQVKLAVRDAVLSQLEGVLKDGASQDEAKRAIQDNIKLLTACADEALKRESSPDTASVTLTEEQFPTRYYDTFTLPAGSYTSLRVTIGDGAGHNWWCVVFPPLCSGAAIDEAAAPAFSEDEIELITGDSGETVVKFKTLEILAKVREWFAKSVNK